MSIADLHNHEREAFEAPTPNPSDRQRYDHRERVNLVFTFLASLLVWPAGLVIAVCYTVGALKNRRPWKLFPTALVGGSVAAFTVLYVGLSILSGGVHGSQLTQLTPPSAVATTAPAVHTTPKVTYPLDRSTSPDGTTLQIALPPKNLDITNDGTFMGQDEATPVISALLENHWSAVCESNLFFLRNADETGSPLWQKDMVALKKGLTPCSGPLQFDGMQYDVINPDTQGMEQYDSKTQFVWGFTFLHNNKVVGHRYLTITIDKARNIWLLSNSYSHTPPCLRYCK